jgi:hypothetical protein
MAPCKLKLVKHFNSLSFLQQPPTLRKSMLRAKLQKTLMCLIGIAVLVAATQPVDDNDRSVRRTRPDEIDKLDEHHVFAFKEKMINGKTPNI